MNNSTDDRYLLKFIRESTLPPCCEPVAVPGKDNVFSLRTPVPLAMAGYSRRIICLGLWFDIPRGVAISLRTAEDQYQRLYELQRKNILVCEGPTYLTGLQQTPLMVKLHNYGPDIQHYAVGDEIAWLVVNWIPVMALQGFSDMEGRFNDYQQRTK